ncbi:hypothetical protein [Nostoc sp.]|uniref:hypothetical protein n=1 Tax=Nostoc sp. TaxID=1180 RepID=UPI002FF5F097
MAAVFTSLRTFKSIKTPFIIKKWGYFPCEARGSGRGNYGIASIAPIQSRT